MKTLSLEILMLFIVFISLALFEGVLNITSQCQGGCQIDEVQPDAATLELQKEARLHWQKLEEAME